MEPPDETKKIIDEVMSLCRGYDPGRKFSATILSKYSPTGFYFISNGEASYSADKYTKYQKYVYDICRFIHTNF